MAKRRLSKELRRVQLLDTAAGLFGRGSFAQVTTADLAKAAGVTEPVLYQHFKTKLDLFVAVLKRAKDVTIEHYDEVSAAMPTPLLKLIAVVRVHGDVMRKNEPYFRLHLRALAESDLARVRGVLRDNYLAYNRYFAELIRRGQAQGEVHKAVDAEQTAWFIMSQGVFMNLCNQLGIKELQEHGYVEGLMADALSHISLIEDPLKLAAQIAGQNSGVGGQGS